MTKTFVRACLLVTGLIIPTVAVAQDVAITNARIIVGSGQVIESGTIIVRGGKIVSVTAGAAPTQGLRTIDAKGMSAMPGFIDGHKHVNNFNAEQMKSLLEAGYTTVLVRRRAGGAEHRAARPHREGRVHRPAHHPVGADQSPSDTGRSASRRAGAGRERRQAHRRDRTDPGARTAAGRDRSDQSDRGRSEEGGRAGQRARGEQSGDGRGRRCRRDAPGAHAEQGLHDLRSGRASGADRLDRRRHDRLRRAEHRHAVGPPAAVQWPKDNTARFRDGKPWPEAIAGANRDPKGRATGTEGGYTIINIRRIWDADPNHQTVSYSTDQNAADLVVLEHELKSYSIVFSMADIHKIIGPNSARYVGMADQIGTLEAGKLADIILIDGNPTLNIYEMLKTKVVLKEGKVVVDKR